MSDAVDLLENAERLAKTFHELYEKLAPRFGYQTRPESAVPWNEVPDQNRALMIAVATALIDGHSHLLQRPELASKALPLPPGPQARHWSSQLQQQLVGRTIVQAGYVPDTDWHVALVLLLDNGGSLTVAADDEGNAPGVLLYTNPEHVPYTFPRLGQ